MISCCFSILASVYYYNISNAKEEVIDTTSSSGLTLSTNPTSSSGTTSYSFVKPEPKDYKGFYRPYIDGKTERGSAECINTISSYNSINKFDPYVAYTVRGTGHGTGDINSCMYYKKSNMDNVEKIEISSSGPELTTRCIDPSKYPDNYCTNSPPPIVTEIEPFDGWYDNYIEGRYFKERGESACKSYLTEYNYKNESNPYVAYSVRPGEPYITNDFADTCTYYKRYNIESAKKINTSNYNNKLITKCADPTKDPSNRCR